MRVFLGRAWRNLNRRVSRLYLKRQRQSVDHGLVRYGSDYGGWYAPADMPQGALCYCVGVGVDASFDFGIRQAGAETHAFDPTPGSIAYMAENADKGVVFHPWGLWNEDKKMKFFFPLHADHTSFFIQDLHHTNEYFEGECYRLGTILAKLGHPTPFLLKIDIEGSWFEAIQDFVGDGILPKYLGVEFDSPAPVWRVARIVRLLDTAGYKVLVVEKDNVTFGLPD